MQVNFGRYLEVNEIERPTRNQYYIKDVIKNAFALEEDCFAPYSDKCKTVETLLEEKKNADILIRNKKDGSVDVEIRKYYSNPDIKEEDIIYNEGIIPFDVKGKYRLKKTNIKLDMGKDFRKSIVKEQKKMDDFAIKCRAYALAPDTDKNMLLERKHEIELERKLRYLER